MIVRKSTALAVRPPVVRTPGSGSAAPEPKVIRIQGSGGQKRNTVVPDTDPFFFRVIRLLKDGRTVKDPYTEHVWSYAGIQSIIKPISSIPFQLYKEDEEATKGGTKKPTSKELGYRADLMHEIVPTISKQEGMFIARQASAGQRFASIRRVAPWLKPWELAAATGDVIPVTDGDWPQLFERPNDMDTFGQAIEQTIIALKTTGRAFWTLRDDNYNLLDPGAIPKQLWVRSGNGWKPRVNKASGQFMGWKLEWIDGAGNPREEKFQPHQLIFLRYVLPDYPFKGLSAVEPAMGEIQLDHLAGRFAKNFLKEGAMIGGVLTSDEPLGPEREAELQDEFDAEHAGAENAGRTAVLSGGLKWIPNTASHRDMEFTQTRAHAQMSTLASLRTSQAVVGPPPDIKAQDMEAALRAHWDTTLLPEVYYLETMFNTRLLVIEPGYDPYAPRSARPRSSRIWGSFDLSTVEALRENLFKKLRSANILSTIGYPLDLINQRLGLGLKSVAWGKTWYRPSATLPVNAFEAKNPDPPAPLSPVAPGGKGKGKPGGTPDAKDKNKKEPSAPPSDTKKSKDAPALGSSEHWEEVAVELLEPSEERFKRRYRRLLNGDLRTAQIRRIEESSDTASADEVLFPLREWQEAACSKFASLYLDISRQAEDEAEQEAESLGFTTVARDAADDAEWIADLQTNLLHAINTIHREIREVFLKADSKDSAARLVRAAFNRLSTSYRLSRVAVSEVGFIVSSAREGVFGRAGVEFHQWVRSGGIGEDRESHSEYAKSGVVRRGHNFSAPLTGDQAMIRHPHDLAAPPAERIGCWCLVVPALDPDNN